MAPFTPLPLIDDFLLDYHAGHAVLLLFVLAMLGSLVLRSRKVIALNMLAFGALFALMPSSMAPLQFRLLGIGLFVVSPLLFVTGNE